VNRRATFPAEINNALAGPLSQLQLHVNVQKRHPSGPPYGLYVAFPTIMHSNLVSLNLMSRALESQPASYIDQLRNLVVRSTKLETLRIMGTRVFESWQAHHGRMPPLKELYLGRWSTSPRSPGRPNHDPNIWDFSRLRKVSSKYESGLWNSSTFMGSFSSQFVAGLKSLEYSPCPRMGSLPPTNVEVKHHKQTNQDLIRLINDNDEIEELLITCYFASEIVPAITSRVGPTLKALRLRSPDFLDPDTSLENVMALRMSCSMLTDLEISIMFPDRVEVAHNVSTIHHIAFSSNVQLQEPEHPTFIIISELSEMRRLQRLKLVAQSPSYSVDQSPQMQKAIIDIARNGKHGAPLSNLSLFFPYCKKAKSRYESCVLDYSWDFLGKQTFKKSRDIANLDWLHPQCNDSV